MAAWAGDSPAVRAFGQWAMAHADDLLPDDGLPRLFRCRTDSGQAWWREIDREEWTEIAEETMR